MRTFFITVRLFLITLALLQPQFPAAAAGSDDVKTVVSGNSAFAFGLYSQLQTNKGNLFFSPYSLSTCLAITAAGARGDTEAQMNRVLQLGTNRAQTLSAFGALQHQLDDLHANKEIALNIANGLWAQQGRSFLPDFLDAAGKNFNATLQQAEFRDAEPARKEINDWVAARTKDKITGLVPSGAISGATRLVIVNAIYFKCPWTHPFDKARTTNAPFNLLSGEKVQAPFMHRTTQFKYAAFQSLQVLELPFSDESLSMLVFLPAEGSLPAFERVMNAPGVNSWLSASKVRRVNVSLPKFKLTEEFSLSQTLTAMGMTNAFSTAADFSGMDGSRDLFISTVVHKALVEVSEEGTEAAAATGAVMALKAVRDENIPVFRADRPFIFLIRDNRTGSILFLGRVEDPTK